MSDSFLEDNFPSMSNSDWVIVAFRYFVGQMTIAACAFASDLAHAWDSLPAVTRSIIQSELEDEFRRDDKDRSVNSGTLHPLGMDMDREAWELVRKAYTK